MTFRSPSPATYFISLIIACVVTGLTYLALGPGANGLLLLGLGLVVGHFFGSWFGDTPKAAATVDTAGAPAPTASEGEGSKSLYVGNVAFSAPKEELRELFAAYGTVKSVRLMTDRATGKPRGYGFVEMEAPAADSAIAALDGKEFYGRNLRVNEAKQRAPRQEG